MWHAPQHRQTLLLCALNTRGATAAWQRGVFEQRCTNKHPLLFILSFFYGSLLDSGFPSSFMTQLSLPPPPRRRLALRWGQIWLRCVGQLHRSGHWLQAVTLLCFCTTVHCDLLRLLSQSIRASSQCPGERVERKLFKSVMAVTSRSHAHNSASVGKAASTHGPHHCKVLESDGGFTLFIFYCCNHTEKALKDDVHHHNCKWEQGASRCPALSMLYLFSRLQRPYEFDIKAVASVCEKVEHNRRAVNTWSWQAFAHLSVK